MRKTRDDKPYWSSGLGDEGELISEDPAGFGGGADFYQEEVAVGAKDAGRLAGGKLRDFEVGFGGGSPAQRRVLFDYETDAGAGLDPEHRRQCKEKQREAQGGDSLMPG